MFKEGQEVWVAFKDGSNKYKATVIATGEHFTCVQGFEGYHGITKKIVENKRVFALDYQEVKKHPHAELMFEYALDAMETDKPYERWEFCSFGADWRPLIKEPIWQTDYEYRRKPKTIKIGEYDVPEPLREAPAEGTRCYMPNILDLDNTFTYYTEFNPSNNTHRLGLVKGNLHLTQEAAELHAKALLSFTTTG